MAYRSGAIATGTSVTELTATPAGSQVDDYLCGSLTMDGGAGAPTPPTGWVERVNIDLAAPDGGRVRYADKVAVGGDAFTWTFTIAAGAVINVALSGRNTSAPRTAVTGEKNESSNTTPIAVSHTGVTATQGDDVVVFMQLDQTVAADDWNFSTITNYTEQFDNTTEAWITAAFDQRDNVNSGATGALDSTATRTAGTGNAGWSVIVAAIAAAAGGGPTVTWVGYIG